MKKSDKQLQDVRLGNIFYSLTKKEFSVLNEIKECNYEDGYSEFTSDDVKTKSIAGVVSSLLQKELIYDCYEGLSEGKQGKYKMWCLSLKGIELVGTCENYIKY